MELSQDPSKRVIVAVFGSGRVRRDTVQYGQARELGRELAGRGLAVCSGGYGGVMEAASRGAHEAGGYVIGVTARAFRARANRWVGHEVRVGTWQERLFELVRQGDGYAVCQGGTGTLVELAAVWEMLNKGLMRAKPIALLGPFWLPVIQYVSQAESGRSSEGRTCGASVIQLAASPADAARYFEECLLRRSGRGPAR